MKTPYARIVLARHGESAWNVEDRYQGHADSGLTVAGRTQAEDLADWLLALPGQPPTLLAASDLARARDTADAFARRTGQPVHVDARLREVDTGAWTGRLFTEIAREHPDDVAAAARGEDVRRGGGETFAELRKRVWLALTELARKVHAAKPPAGIPTASVPTMVVFTHGGPIRVAAAEAVGAPSPGHAAMAPPPNCSVTVLETDGAASRLVVYNASTSPGATAARAE